ncbi:MAG: AAA family ATPase, partial [Actinomycetes bacterium]
MGIETTTELLEREDELAELADALSHARQSRGRVVLVEATAGLGKTSLLRASSGAAAEAGFTCLRARASELERDFAYGCVRQLLEPVVARAAQPERARLFEGAAALAMPLFAPTGGVAAAPSGDAFAMLHGLYWLLNNLTDEGPVVLAVDDLHWSDRESLRFLAYLAPRLDGLPVAVLASARPEESGTGDLARLVAAPEITVLRPRPLSDEGTAALCVRRLGTEVAPDFAAACREATLGNPFFLEALLREAKEEGLAAGPPAVDRVRQLGPAAVARAVLLRLAGQPAARALVRAVAVLGDGAGLADVAPLAGLSVADAAAAADLVAGLAILRPGDGLAFAHPVVREAVYADIGRRERARMHARAAGILAGRGASDERVAAQTAAAEP